MNLIEKKYIESKGVASILKVLFVTVQYHQEDKTEQFLKSIFSINNSNVEVSAVVVDNAYHEFNRNKIELEKIQVNSNIKIIPNENTGYFSGLNVGINSIENIDVYDYIIGCNNDIIVDEDFYSHLPSLTDPKINSTCFVPRIIGPSLEDQNPQYHGSIPILKRLFLFCIFHLPRGIGYYLHTIMYKKFGRNGMKARLNNPNDLNEVFPIHLPLGAIFLFTPMLYRKIGGFPEESFLYGEEMFLRRVLLKNDCRFRMCLRLRVSHLESATTSLLPAYNKWLKQRAAFQKFKWFYLRGK